MLLMHPESNPNRNVILRQKKLSGLWTYGRFLTGSEKQGLTIHPAVIEFKNKMYFFYHDGSNTLNGEPDGDTRRILFI